MLKEVGDYKSEFLDLQGGKRQNRAQNVQKYLKEAEIMARARETHESQHPFASDGFTGFEAPDYKHKRVLDVEDINQVKLDAMKYISSLQNPEFDKGNFAEFTSHMVDQLIDQAMEEDLDMLDEVQEDMIHNIAEKEINKLYA